MWCIFLGIVYFFSPKQPTGPIRSSSQNVCIFIYLYIFPLKRVFLAWTKSAFLREPSPLFRGKYSGILGKYSGVLCNYSGIFGKYGGNFGQIYWYFGEKGGILGK